MLYKVSILTVLSVSGFASAAVINHRPVHPRAVPEIPLLGFGTWNLAKSNASEVVATALQTGFRHIDAAFIYGNQVEVGEGLKKGLSTTGLRREDIWVTSKLWNDRHSPEQVPLALAETLDQLDLDYLDLYLMHWPVADDDGKYAISFVDTWEAMTLLLVSGKVRHIGIANFSPSQLRELLDSPAGRVSRPYAHQFETHPYLPQSEWLSWHQTYGIHVTAYSPLANSNPTYAPGDDIVPLLKNPVVNEIGKKRGCSAAQVALKWGLLRRTSIIPKSSHENRIIEDFQATTCDLHLSDLVTLEKKLPIKRFSNPSERWGVPLFDGLEGTGGVMNFATKAETFYNMASSIFQRFRKQLSFDSLDL